jgi:hypothetical protein
LVCIAGLAPRQADITDEILPVEERRLLGHAAYILLHSAHNRQHARMQHTACLGCPESTPRTTFCARAVAQKKVPLFP